MIAQTSRVHQRLTLLPLVMVLLVGLSWNAFGQITIPLSQLNPKLAENVVGKTHTIEFLNGRLYIGTEKGLWIVSNNDAKAIEVKSIKEAVYQIVAFGDEVIAKSERPQNSSDQETKAIKNLWIVSKDGTATKVDGIGDASTVFDFNVVGKHSFFRTDEREKLWIVDKQGRAISVNVHGWIGSTSVLGNELLVSTTDALWLVNENGEARSV